VHHAGQKSSFHYIPGLAVLREKSPGVYPNLVNCVSAAIVIITECRDSKNPVGAHRNGVEMKRLKAKKENKNIHKTNFSSLLFLRSPSHAILCPKL
jgi:hypothetical protein